MTFKKIIPRAIFLILLSFILNTSIAQPINFSVKAGYNISYITTNLSGKSNVRPGFSTYLSGDLSVHKNIMISVEGGYTQKGYRNDDFFIDTTSGSIGISGTGNNRLDYIDLSILGKFGGQSGITFLYALAGPSLGFKIGSDASSTISEVDLTYQEQFLNEFKKNSLGLKFGFGAEIELATITIISEARYNTDVADSYYSNRNGLGDFKIKNQVLEFLVGVKF